MILWSIALAALWVLATEFYAPGNLLVGLTLGAALALMFKAPRSQAEPDAASPPVRSPHSPTAPAARRPPPKRGLGARAVAAVWLFIYFLEQLVIANVKMAMYTVSPLSRTKPGIVAVPLEPMSDGAIMLLANLITLTPGTLSVDVSTDHRFIYIHVMEVSTTGDGPTPQAIIDEVKTGFERRVLEVMR